MLKKLIKDIKKHKVIYLMAIPLILYYGIFHYAPMGGLIIAFQNYRPARGILKSDFVGFKHFIDFFNNAFFFRLIRNTFVINLKDIVIGFPIPIIIAILLNELKSKVLKNSIQTLIYIPHFISMVIICSIIRDFCDTDGIFNQLFLPEGIRPFNWLAKVGWFQQVLVGSNVWQYAGWNSIIYVAAISGINTELYDAAYVDGCGRWRRILHVTLPGMLPTVIIMLIMRIGRIMSVGYEKIILLYNDTVMETADVISSYVYRRGILEYSYGYSAAVGMFNSLINVAFLVFANYMSRKFSEQSLW